MDALEEEKETLRLKQKPKVIIIGAGIAGISAADALTKAGITDVKLLEATGQTGGRIWTLDIGKFMTQKRKRTRFYRYQLSCFVSVILSRCNIGI